jgi:hypothetical protein
MKRADDQGGDKPWLSLQKLDGHLTEYVGGRFRLKCGIMRGMKSHMRSIIAYRITTERYLLAAG